LSARDPIRGLRQVAQGFARRHGERRAAPGAAWTASPAPSCPPSLAIGARAIKA
jgi:hypothetical protein